MALSFVFCFVSSPFQACFKGTRLKFDSNSKINWSWVLWDVKRKCCYIYSFTLTNLMYTVIMENALQLYFEISIWNSRDANFKISTLCKKFRLIIRSIILSYSLILSLLIITCQYIQKKKLMQTKTLCRIASADAGQKLSHKQNNCRILHKLFWQHFSKPVFYVMFKTRTAVFYQV